MQKGKVTGVFFRFTSKAATPFKVIIPVILVLLLLAAQITPLYAQLNAARNLTGTWQSSSAGMYYEMDPAGTGIRETDVTATFEMDITQQGNQISITLDLNPISWTTDPAYWQEYGIPAAPEIAGSIGFTGTVSSSSFTATEQGALTQEQLTGSFTSDIITATLTGNAQETNPNGIVVTLTSSPPIQPTPTPASSTPAPTSASSTQPTFDRFMGSVALVKAPAWFTNTGVNVPLSSGQMGSGDTVLTGNNSIVSFTYPYQDGTVYLDGNTAAGWVGLTSEPAPDNQIAYSVYPSNIVLPQSWGNDGWETLGGMVLEAGIDVAFLGASWGTAGAVAIVVEGGVFVLHHGTAYMNEHYPHIFQVPQGDIVGGNTEYVVNVSDEVTTVQVIDGPVYFIDPTTNNTITVDSNQMLTLPPAGQSGFSEQALQSDVSAFNPASTNQWWTQTTPNASSSLANFLSGNQLTIIAVVIVAIIIAIAAVVATKRRGTRLQQPGIQDARMSSTVMPAPAMPESPKTTAPIQDIAADPSPVPNVEQQNFTFCPNCGKQLPPTKKFCPFCGFNLSGGDSTPPPQMSARAPQPSAPSPQPVATIQVYPTNPPKFLSHSSAIDCIYVMMMNRKLNVRLGGFSSKLTFKEDGFILKKDELPPDIAESAKTWDEAKVINWLAQYIPRTLAKAGIVQVASAPSSPQMSSAVARTSTQVPQAGAPLKVTPTKPPRFFNSDVQGNIVFMLHNHKIDISLPRNFKGGDRFKIVDDNLVVITKQIPPEIAAAAKRWDDATVINWLAPYIPRAIAKAKANPKAGIT